MPRGASKVREDKCLQIAHLRDSRGRNRSRPHRNLSIRIGAAVKSIARVSSYFVLGWQSALEFCWLFVTPSLLPFVGWRDMFLLGLLPALVAFVVRRVLDEPELFVKKN